MMMVMNLALFPAESIYYSIDEDGNGGISKAEFASWWFTDQCKEGGMKLEVDVEDMIDNYYRKDLTKVEKNKLKEKMWWEQMQRMGLASRVP